jgi:hypothetical protein
MQHYLCWWPILTAASNSMRLTSSSSAGSETTASLLGSLTHWLLKTPRAYEKLVKEIRSIEKADELTHDRLQKLSYLDACIDEGLRIFPPVPGGNLRCIPKGGASVCGHRLPEGVRCYIFLSFRITTFESLLTNFPDNCFCPILVRDSRSSKFPRSRNFHPGTLARHRRGRSFCTPRKSAFLTWT